MLEYDFSFLQKSHSYPFSNSQAYIIIITKTQCENEIMNYVADWITSPVIDEFVLQQLISQELHE